MMRNFNKAGIGTYWDNLKKHMIQYEAAEGASIMDKIYFSPHYSQKIPFWGRYPKVFMIHDLAFKKYNYYSDRGGIFQVIRKVEYMLRHWLIFKIADAIIVATQFTKDEFKMLYPDVDQSKIFVVPLGLDHMLLNENSDFEKYLPSDWSQRGYLLYTGGVQFNKNTDGTLRAYEKFKSIYLLENDSAPPYLVLAGKIYSNESNPRVSSLKELIRQLGLEKDVHFTGSFEESAKYSLIKNAKIYLHLSFYEGWGIAMGEGMKAGVCVLADDNSTYPELAGDSVMLVDGTDPDAVAQSINKLLQDKELRKSLGKKAQAKAQEYTWKKCATGTVEVLKETYEKYYN